MNGVHRVRGGQGVHTQNDPPPQIKRGSRGTHTK